MRRRLDITHEALSTSCNIVDVELFMNNYLLPRVNIPASQ
jgi:hypothetical protein